MAKKTKSTKSKKSIKSEKQETKSSPKYQGRRGDSKKKLSFTEQMGNLGSSIRIYDVMQVWPGGPELQNNIDFFGMGGSAQAADLVLNYFSHFNCGDILNIRKDYFRKTDLTQLKGAIFSSYSGTTEETVSQAVGYPTKRGVVITTGGDLEKIALEKKWGKVTMPEGYQPRAALGFSFSVIVSLLLRHKRLQALAPRISADVNITGKHISELQKANKFDQKAENIAKKLEGKRVVIVSSQMINGVNRRWQGQLLENANHLTFSQFMPESTHNFVNGLSKEDAEKGDLAFVFLHWKHDALGGLNRMKKAATMVRDLGYTISEISTETKALLPSLFELVYLADVVSLKLAELKGVDPQEISGIESLKKA
ncbi:MAG: hypothetical protein Kapaf2KO_19830 [Candidatus Kapaibacteriales bacterium]